ncbi:hypothetical protein D1816_12490 [Aquimarina sp. AD10]|uniref:hypothetical protein n=1 Tax=Aquimarina sp. AD10 TaxID=1714849 RepID=UPI000E4BCAF0|nr:hypothetical protein [Aquimarina sp. AD10]AXT61129.1 hypothetical protein D1816_12490 [Aquimarina sp. AD10]RKN02255.1 hypothetical protein D7033_02120 [Aquimarina sp. AD10]
MKLNIVNFTIFLFTILSFSQTKSYDDQMKWMKGWTNFDPNHEDYPEAEEKLPNIINTDSYLSNDVVYLMSGNVYITDNATLTIQEGTIIRCDTEDASSLVVTKGSRLIAKGSKTLPIVFTSNNTKRSRNPGDWGGIIVIGSGKVNAATSKTVEGNFLAQYAEYGGSREDENTTEMSYVRIEYAGKKINQSKELNGLSLYALGKNSILHHIMISYSADDSFEVFGGSANMNNLISFKAKDDDYDFTLGYTGMLDNILAIRHPYISDSSGSYAIEADGYDPKSGLDATRILSEIHIKNATLINLSDISNYKFTTAAISSKNMAKLNVTQSRISGFANVVLFDTSYTSYTDLENKFLLENSIFNVHGPTVIAKSQFATIGNIDQLLKYNMYTKHFQAVDNVFVDPFHRKHPKFTIKDSDTYTVMQ